MNNKSLERDRQNIAFTVILLGGVGAVLLYKVLQAQALTPAHPTTPPVLPPAGIHLSDLPVATGWVFTTVAGQKVFSNISPEADISATNQPAVAWFASQFGAGHQVYARKQPVLSIGGSWAYLLSVDTQPDGYVPVLA